MGDKNQKKSENDKKIPLYRVLFAELLGTFILTFIDAGLAVFNPMASEATPLIVKILAPAFVVMTMIFIFGEISGAHINPAVTLSFAVRGVFPWRKCLPYIFFQLLGAIIAGFLLVILAGPQASLGLNSIKESVWLGASLEVLMSWFLITAILITACESHIKGFESGFPVGFTLIFCGCIGKAFTGSSMNPARSIGPAIALGNFTNIWIYVVAPIVGGFIAVLTAYLLMGPPTEDDRKAAQGN